MQLVIFYQHLLLHAYVQKFDMTESKKIWNLNKAYSFWLGSPNREPRCGRMGRRDRAPCALSKAASGIRHPNCVARKKDHFLFQFIPYRKQISQEYP
jgi:hypothetical protein